MLLECYSAVKTFGFSNVPLKFGGVLQSRLQPSAMRLINMEIIALKDISL